MSHDIRMALRSLARRPGFTALSVLTLAVAAGANAAILACVYGVLLKPLPYAEPSRLAAVWPGRFQSNADLVHVREHSPTLSSVAAVAPGWSMSLTDAGDPVRVTVARTSGNLFHTLGAPAMIGRTFSETDARPGAPPVAVLSSVLWLTKFGGDRSIVGRTIHLDGEPVAVVGVMPPAFEVFGLKTDMYTPFPLDASAWYHRLSFSLYVARLTPGVSMEQADREYRALIARVRREQHYPTDYGRTARLEDLRTATVGGASAALLVLAMAVGVILLIAGANIGTLMLTRTASRAREIAVRSAVGASRLRVARELLVEGTLVALAGGILGVLLARLLLPVLLSILPKETPRLAEIAVNAPVAGLVLLAAMLVGLIAGVAPALASLRVRTALLLHAGAHSESRQGKRARALLTSAEIALALVLSIGAALMVQSLWRLQRVDPGFNADNVLTLRVQPTTRKNQEFSTALYYGEVLERIRSLPGVTAAGAIQHLPFSGYSWTANLDIEGHEPPPGAARPTAGLRIVTPGYFPAIGQPLIAGRVFTADDPHREGAVIVNESLARRYYSSAGGALNRRLRIRGGGIQSGWLSIVGVVGDVRHTALTDPIGLEIYTPVATGSIPAMMVAVRTSGNAMALTPAVREAIWSVDRNVPLSDIQTMTAKIGDSLGRPRLLVRLLGAFAGIGLLVTLVGVYAVVAYSVSQRRREIGIMLALGAGRNHIARGVIREGMLYAVAGLAIGLPAAWSAARVMQSVLYGVSATDLATFAALPAVITVVILAATAVPALRAMRVDPQTALRTD